MLSLVACAGLWGCASEEIPTYGVPAQISGVGGGGNGTSSGGSGGGGGATCDPTCKATFAEDVFPVLDTTAKCATGALCHGADGSSPGDFQVTAADPDSYYDLLTTFVIESGEKYVVACDPDNSKLLCNLKVSDGDNPRGACGKKLMPIDPADAPTLAQIKAIEDWIACGAPKN